MSNYDDDDNELQSAILLSLQTYAELPPPKSTARLFEDFKAEYDMELAIQLSQRLCEEDGEECKKQTDYFNLSTSYHSCWDCYNENISVASSYHLESEASTEHTQRRTARGNSLKNKDNDTDILEEHRQVISLSPPGLLPLEAVLAKHRAEDDGESSYSLIDGGSCSEFSLVSLPQDGQYVDDDDDDDDDVDDDNSIFSEYRTSKVPVHLDH